MNRKDFNDLVATARARQDKLRNTKGQEYIRYDEDQLNNFKRIAADCGVSPLVVWFVYASKHWDAIVSFVKTGNQGTEGITGRLDDLGNYLNLLEGLLVDQQIAARVPIPRGMLALVDAAVDYEREWDKVPQGHNILREPQGDGGGQF